MRQIFLDTIRAHNLIEENDTIIIGFSGGMDSSCLLDLLVSIKDELNLRLIGAHFNHQVRKEARSDEEFCKKRCEDLGIEFFSRSGSMEAYAKEKKISQEAAGRILRQEFFKDLMDTTGAKKIALAHNYNDQVETLLMRIFRGTGLDGLRGMDYRDGNIIRPLLAVKRSAIEAYIKEENIPYVEDKTNFENDYHRNKIRNLLIPYIEKTLNTEIEDQIFNLSELAKIDTAFLDQLTEEAFIKLTRKRSKDSIALDRQGFLSLDQALRYRIIRRTIEDITGYLEDISHKNIEEVDSLFSKESGKFIDNLGGLRIRRSYDLVIFEKTRENTNSPLYIDLKEGINDINDKLKIQLSLSKEAVSKKDTLSIPKDLVSGSLVLRTRKNGDRLRPQGLNGTKKLKDIFIDKKIDRDQRDSYLILADREKIFAVLDLINSEYINTRSPSGEYILVSLLKEEDKDA